MSRIVSITAGRGPVECRRAVARVRDALVREADELGISCDEMAGVDLDGEGPSSTRLVLSDAGAVDALLHRWVGTVKCIAPSDRRSKSDRKNWFVGVSMERTTVPPPLVRAEDVSFSTMTAGGPGGQHQNKTESAVRAVHLPTGTTVVAREERSQHRNRKLALDRIAAILAIRGQDEAMATERSNWLDRIVVQRGSPVRVLTD